MSYQSYPTESHGFYTCIIFAIFVCCFVPFLMLQIVKMYMTIVTGRKKKCSNGNNVRDIIYLSSPKG
jgi:hypothetical protein